MIGGQALIEGIMMMGPEINIHESMRDEGN